jgi:hypothetical protein
MLHGQQEQPSHIALLLTYDVCAHDTLAAPSYARALHEIELLLYCRTFSLSFDAAGACRSVPRRTPMYGGPMPMAGMNK